MTAKIYSFAEAKARREQRDVLAILMEEYAEQHAALLERRIDEQPCHGCAYQTEYLQQGILFCRLQCEFFRED